MTADWDATRAATAPDRAALRPPSLEGATARASMIIGAASPDPVVLDDTDRALLNCVLADGKTTNRDLAQQIGVSESAISVRLRRLRAEGVLIFSAIIDWDVAGFEWFIACRLKSRIRHPRDLAVDISRLPQCQAAAVTLGSHDVVAYLLAAGRTELSAVIDAISAIPGIAELNVDLAVQTAVTHRGHQLFLATDAPPIRLPSPRIDIDDLDIAVIQALINDSRQSSRSIARALGVSEGTVRARISRMTQSGLVRTVAMVEPVAFGLAGVIASVAVRAERSSLSAIVDALVDMPNVVFAATCLGNVELHCTIIGTEPRDVMNFVGTSIQPLPGVISTDTLLFVDVVRFSPYIKRLANQ